MALKLSNDFGSIFDPENTKKTKEKLSYLNKAFNKNDDFRMGEHYHSILVNTYIAFLERLKIYFLFFIGWNTLTKKKKIHGIGEALEILKHKYPLNDYLLYFNSDIRNSLTHYTFSWKHGNGGKIILYSEIFDPSPKEMSLVDFMKEIIELRVLVEGFYILLRDKFNLPEIKVEMFER